MYTRFLSCAALGLALTAGCLPIAGQIQPSAPAPHAELPAAPEAAGGPKFPPAPASNFTAAVPTKAEVNGFLHASWGYDTNRVWEVYKVEKTQAPGVSKVTVLVGEKPNPRIGDMGFFVTPDGHHLIADNAVLDFGPHPFEANYRMLQQRANGPSLGAPGKQLELVEFADFECPHCKDAQPLVQKLIRDFPQAHYVFEMFPLVSIHPMAFKAAAYASCADQQAGSAGFFKYADAVFAAQAELEGANGELALRNAATGAGLDPDKLASCADSPATKAKVEESMQLGQDLNVNATPTLFIDGRGVPMMEVPYEQLKTIIEWQFSLDKGVQ
jgi:protein-disulfide isomerase